jgi:1-phosphofructokinase family hexose kinase
VILVVNPNPALDRVAVVHFQKASTLRPVRFSIWAGGSGTHAGYVAHLLGEDVVVQAFAGGHTGALFREQLQRQGLEPDLVLVEGETRQTFSLLDVDTGNICDVPEQGPEVTLAQAQALESRALARIADAALVILSGSLPPGCPVELPNRLIEAARAAGVPCIADLAGPLLLGTLSSLPWLIKPSRTEVGELLGKAQVTIDDALHAARTWQQAGAENVCISLDAAGLLWVSPQGAVQFTSPAVPAYNSIGCGDTLVGAVAAIYVQTRDLSAALRAGVAAAAANIAYDAPGYVTPDDIERLLPQVQTQRLTTVSQGLVSGPGNDRQP